MFSLFGSNAKQLLTKKQPKAIGIIFSQDGEEEEASLVKRAERLVTLIEAKLSECETIVLYDENGLLLKHDKQIMQQAGKKITVTFSSSKQHGGKESLLNFITVLAKENGTLALEEMTVDEINSKRLSSKPHTFAGKSTERLDLLLICKTKNNAHPHVGKFAPFALDYCEIYYLEEHFQNLDLLLHRYAKTDQRFGT